MFGGNWAMQICLEGRHQGGFAYARLEHVGGKIHRQLVEPGLRSEGKGAKTDYEFSAKR